MTDKQLRDDVLKELDWEPSVDAADIGVTVENGIVTLSGNVPTYSQKIAAETAARRVKGVRAIVQMLEVRLGVADGDEVLARRALDVLDWNVSIPKGAVQVEVSHGLVVLSGQVDWEFQRRAADEAMHKLGGIVGVVNNISLRPRVSPSDVKMRIQTALERHADIEAAKVHVDVDGGKVTLTGKVKTWNERDLIESAVWAAPGVRTIEDRVSIG